MTRFQRRLLVFALPVLLIAGAAAFLLLRSDEPGDPFRAGAIGDDAPFTSISYGVQAFLWWDDGFSGLHMDWVRLMDFTHVKQIFAWHDIEPEPGDWHFGPGDRVIDALERRQLHPVIRLGGAPDWATPSLPGREAGGYVDAPPDADFMTDWANFCGTVAARYAGRVAGYQVWNEPNLTREWGGLPPDAVAYVELLRVCSEAIRAADPEAAIISAGLAPTGVWNDDAHPDDIYLHAMYDAGFQQYADVVGVHAPGFTAPAIAPEDAPRGRWGSFRRVEDLRRVMVERGDESRQMAILEMGYTTDPRPGSGYDWFAVDEAAQAEHLRDAFTYIAEHWRPWVGLVTVIYIPKTTWTPDDEEYWWSITDPEMTRIRPAFDALARMPKYCGDVVIPARTPEEAGVATEHNPCY